MDLMNVMGWDEQADLFVSDKPIRARARTHQVMFDGREDKVSSDLKKMGLTIGKDEFGHGVRALTNGVLDSNGIVSNGNGEPNQVASMLGSSVIIKPSEGKKVSVEVNANGSGVIQRKLGMEEKVRNSDNYIEEKYISVFIGNIPPFANNRWIFDNFVKIGKVADYYTSGRLSKSNKNHFGFVRFHSLEDANKAVELFNGTWVDGFKLEVELARYPRRLGKVEENCFVNFSREEQSCLYKGNYDGIGHTESKKAWLNPNKTFAQVLVGNNDAKMADVGISTTKRIKVKANVKECGWLNRSIVAKIRWGTSIRDIKKKLLFHVKGLKAVSRLGIRKVIMSFVSVEDRNQAIISEDWLGCVEDVGVWSGELVCTDKLWDISCSGIPITAWNIETFRSIAEIWGSMVYINDATLLGEDYRMANFLIESVSEIKNSTVDLVVDNNVFQIKVTGTLMENQDGNLDGDEDCKRINEKELAMLAEEQFVEVLAPAYVGQNQFEVEYNAANANWNEDCMANNTDGMQTIKGNLERSIDEQILQYEDSRYDLKNQSVMALFDSVTLDERIEEDPECGDIQNSILFEVRQIVKVDDQGCVLAEDREMQPDLNDACLTSDNLILNSLGQSVTHGSSNQVCCAEADVLEEDSSDCSVHAEFSFGKSETEKSYQMHEMGFKSLPISTNVYQGRIADKRLEAVLEDESQTNTKSVLFCGVEKEVKEMLDLGNLLDIPNVHQFEEAVRDTTSEEIMDEPNSIGGRVKSKRKYTGKSKVQFGGRHKKG